MSRNAIQESSPVEDDQSIDFAIEHPFAEDQPPVQHSRAHADVVAEARADSIDDNAWHSFVTGHQEITPGIVSNNVRRPFDEDTVTVQHATTRADKAFGEKIDRADQAKWNAFSPDAHVVTRDSSSRHGRVEARGGRHAARRSRVARALSTVGLTARRPRSGR